MRFTTLSTLTSTFFVLTIVLLSPIPVANAQNFNVGFINPQKYVVKELGTSEKITWIVTGNKTKLSGIYVDLHLVNIGTEEEWTLQKNVYLLGGTSEEITYPGEPGEYAVLLLFGQRIYDSGIFPILDI